MEVWGRVELCECTQVSVKDPRRLSVNGHVYTRDQARIDVMDLYLTVHSAQYPASYIQIASLITFLEDLEGRAHLLCNSG